MITVYDEEPLLEEFHSGYGSRPKRGCFHPSKPLYRYTVLIIISLICFGVYYEYDAPEPLEHDMKKALSIDHEQFGLLYAVYSIPNIVLVFFGGIIGDRLGYRTSSFLFVSCVLLGSIITSMGPMFTRNLAAPYPFAIMIVGRVVFGIGGESLNVIQNSMTALWFKRKEELATAMGVTLSVSRLGDFLAIVGGVRLSHWFGDFRYALWFGTLLCVFSYFSVLIYIVMDRYAEARSKSRQKLLMQPKQQINVNLKGIKDFDRRYFVLLFVCIFFYGSMSPFIAVASDCLHLKYGYTENQAADISSLIILVSLVFSPVFGKIVDSFGRRPLFMILGILVMLPAHGMMSLTAIPPIYPIILMGVSLSIVPSALWPSIPLIIPEEQIATAFGMMAALQNVGLTVANAIIGAVIDSYNYDIAMMCFLGIDVIGLLFAVAVLLMDTSSDSALTKVGIRKRTDSQILSSLN